MDVIENNVDEIIKQFKSAPYLFIGSGFSRRYLNLEDWEGLLRKFCIGIMPYEYYKSSHDNHLPRIAQAMCKDYNSMVWNSTNKNEITFREVNKAKLQNSSSALKIAISEYLKDFGVAKVNPEYEEEIKAFKAITIEGIITTNWDNLLQDLFPNFQTIIGQNQLLYSSSHGIGEIFKMHGCLSIEESLVLTDEDYKDFNTRNAYLAAKLVTYFVEHPVIFIGYSMTDENITEILSSIINCLGRSNVDKLANNFIFIQRALKDEELIKYSYKDIGGAQIPITIIELFDYSKLYRPLSKIKRQLPIRLLKYFKEQLYEFVHENNPKGKIAVINIEDSTNVDKLEIVVGVGIMSQLGSFGYNQIKAADIIEDVLFDKKKYDERAIIEKTLPELPGFVPIHKFCSKIKKFDSSILIKHAATNFNRDLTDFRVAQYKKQFDENWLGKPLNELLQINDVNKVMPLIPYYDFKDPKEIEELGEYLKSKFNNYFIDSKSITNNSTFFRKVVCLYDLLKYKKS